MIKARNVKWGMGVADVSAASPGDPISLDEYSNSPREAAPSGGWGRFWGPNCLTDEWDQDRWYAGRPVSSLFKIVAW